MQRKTFEEFPLACPECGEENPVGFPACWSCHADLPAERAARPAAPEAPREPNATPERRRPAAPRWLKLELVAVLLAFWLPGVVYCVQIRMDEAALAAEAEDERADGSESAEEYWVEDIEPVPFEDEAYLLLDNLGRIALVLFLVWRGGDWKRVSGLGPQRIGPMALWTIVLLCAWYFADIGIGALRTAATGPPPESYGFDLPESPLTLLLVPVFTVVAAAYEEIFFRAWLWHRLTLVTKRPAVALLLAAAMFAAVHPYDAWESATLIVQALLFGIVFWVERSLWPLILAHALYNLTVAETWAVV